MAKQVIKTEHLQKVLKCSAYSKGTGQRCKQPVVSGATVCMMHGGASPMVRAAAERRIAFMIEPALEVAYELLLDKKTPPATRVTIIKDLLDRFGMKPVEKVDLVKPLWNNPSEMTAEQMDSLIFTLERQLFGENEALARHEERKLLDGGVEDGIVEITQEPQVNLVDKTEPHG